MTRKCTQLIRPLPTIFMAGAVALPSCALNPSDDLAETSADWEAAAQAVEVTTSSAGGSGGSTYSISCPDEMVLTGIRGRAGGYVDRLEGVCSRYDADGQRIDGVSTTSVAGGAGGTPFELQCPGNQAVTKLGGSAATYVDSIAIYCANVGSGGLRASGPSRGESAGGSGGSPYFLSCPDNKIARGLTGRASMLIDRVALLCDQAPVAATRIRKVELNGTDVWDSPAESGSPIPGRVLLNGYAHGRQSIRLTVAGADGTFVPYAIDVANRGTAADFQLTSTNQAAGCPQVTASLNGFSMESSPLLLSTPSAGAGFQFFLDDSLHFSGSPVTGRVSGTLGSVVTFVSSDPNVLTVPSSVLLLGGLVGKGQPIRTSVPMSALRSGCPVVTATKNGLSIRRPVRIVDLGG